jgi:hypothetical protein
MKGETVGREVIRAVCEHLAPWLKAEGFRKRQATFWKVEETHSYQFSLAGFWFDSRDQGTIDLNLGFVWHSADKLRVGGPRTTPRPYWKCTGYSKMRRGRPSRQVGWRVDRKTDLALLATDVEDVVKNHVMPWFAFGAAIVRVLESDPEHALERRRFFLHLLMDSGYTCDGFGADSLQRGGCSVALLRKLDRALQKSGFKLRRMDRIQRAKRAAKRPK